MLKAAKERTKAKSKLFSKKTQKEEQSSETGNVDISEATSVKSLEETIEEAPRSDNIESVDKSDAPVVLSESDSDKSERLQQSVTVIGKDSKGVSDSLKDDENSVISKDTSVLEVQDANSELETTDSVAKLEVSESQTFTTSLTGSFLSSSGDIDNDAETVYCDTERDSSFQELTVDTGAILDNSSEFQNLDRSSSGSDLLQISDSKVEVLLEASSESKTEVPLKTEEEITTGVKLKDETSTEKDKSNFDELRCDVSSSVEFITEKDIPDVENVKTDEQTDSIAEEVVKTASENLSEVDELETDHQVTDAGASQSDTFSVIDKDKSGSNLKISEETISASSEQVDNDSVTDTVKEPVIQESESSFVNLNQHELTGRSESESSINTLDVSLDTCTSEETVVDEGLSSSGTSESMKIKETIDTSEVSNIETETHKKLDDLPDSSSEHGELKDTEQTVDVIVNTESVESQIIPSEEPIKSSGELTLMVEETSDGSDLGERTELSPANSFVKCTLEDAMEESKGDDNSDNHSGTEKSDGSRSIHSGHESADEIDTTTSSDIEIISLPTPNGENRQVRILKN